MYLCFLASGKRNNKWNNSDIGDNGSIDILFFLTIITNQVILLRMKLFKNYYKRSF